VDGDGRGEDRTRLNEALLAALFANMRWLLPALLFSAVLMGAAITLSMFSWVAHKSELKTHEIDFSERLRESEARILDQIERAEERIDRRRGEDWEYLQKLEGEGRTMGSAWQSKLKEDILQELRNEAQE
jgi:hypothetical protein